MLDPRTKLRSILGLGVGIKRQVLGLGVESMIRYQISKVKVYY